MRPTSRFAPRFVSRIPCLSVAALRRLAAAATICPLLWLAGCARLDPNTQPPPATCDPSDSATPCCGRTAVGTGFPGELAAVGTDTTLDLATWNMLNFPSSHPASVGIQMAARIISAASLDLWAVEEIASVSSFDSVLARLPGYAGLVSPDQYSPGNYQKTGVIYRTSVITVRSVTPIFTGDFSAFPRPPLELDIAATANNRTYSFRLIVLHLKAGSTADDLARRRDANFKIRQYLDLQQTARPGVPYLVAGDWNGVLTDAPDRNSFTSLLSDSTDYKFLTMGITGRSDLYSHPASARLIDHWMINRAACPVFARARVVTLRPGDYLPTYQDDLSDHRPVMVAVPVFR
ncbi:MAG: endonuclease/exonuclease/phosphatase family protein [Candidatus Eisenbacteria bacterium]|nr:endonuclease/exonuclease/phosphatase family protein [Candidatus Eisenbacteria bacterium]